MRAHVRQAFRSMRGRALAALIPVLTLASTDIATAGESVVDDNAVIVTTVTLGTLGGLATSISALVYALDGRTFDGGWIVGSLFSSAVCGAMTGAIIAGGIDGRGTSGSLTIIGTLFFGTLTAWPAYWTVRTAVADVEPGERLEVREVPRRDLESAANLTLGERARALPRPALLLPALALRF